MKKDVSVIGVDLAKQVFQLHGATGTGEVVFRKYLSRRQFEEFMKAQPRCRVAMEACGTAHHWARLLPALGHDACLISPKVLKPFAKTQSEAGSGTVRGTVPPPSDMADAEAIAEAASRPTMRFAEIKTPEQQGLGMIFKLRDMLAGPRTQMINSLRGHLPEFGIVAGKGRENIAKLRRALEAEDASEGLPAPVRAMPQLCPGQIDGLSKRISDLDAQIQAASRRTPLSARLRKMPGIGPVTAMAIAAFAPPMDAFGRGRDFPASC
nr:IS110 family transposase [Mangrovicoccus ximenensis]